MVCSVWFFFLLHLVCYQLEHGRGYSSRVCVCVCVTVCVCVCVSTCVITT